MLAAGDEPLCLSCEDPWVNNQRMISCIPGGQYHVVPRTSPKFKQHWHVQDVPGRDMILIHGGNTINDTHGCILIGRAFSRIGALPSIMQSQEALSMLRERFPGEFTLTIR